MPGGASPNQDIIDALTHIADAYKSSGVVYKYKAYRIAIDSIRALTTRIVSPADVANLPGVGKAMVEKVTEILTTGSLQQETKILQDPVAQALQLFTGIHGIGPVLAKKLVHEQHLRTLEDLEGVAHTLPPQARLGLKYHSDTSQRIPFDEIEDHLSKIKTIIAARVDRRLQICCCGSHRRLAATSGDIDVLMTHPATGSDSGSEYVYLHRVVEALSEARYVIDTLASGATKFMGFCRLDNGGLVRRLDIRWVPYDHFFSALLYFTGSDMFNVTMRQEALKRGYTINEYGVFEVVGYEHLHAPGGGTSPSKAGGHADIVAPAGGEKGKRVPITSEADIFALVGMPYVPPDQRSR